MPNKHEKAKGHVCVRYSFRNAEDVIENHMFGRRVTRADVRDIAMEASRLKERMPKMTAFQVSVIERGSGK